MELQGGGMATGRWQLCPLRNRGVSEVVGAAPAPCRTTRGFKPAANHGEQEDLWGLILCFLKLGKPLVPGSQHGVFGTVSPAKGGNPSQHPKVPLHSLCFVFCLTRVFGGVLETPDEGERGGEGESLPG